MRIHRVLALGAAVGALAACRSDTPAMDDALRNDLSLASMNQPYYPQQYMSPIEQGQGYGAQAGYYPQPRYAPQPYYGATPVATRSAPRVIRRAPASGPVYDGGGVNGGSGSGEQPAVTNTARDAVIGAVAGAAIGAVTSGRRDRMKGAVLGAAAGAVLGGVLGSKVDVKRPR